MVALVAFGAPLDNLTKSQLASPRHAFMMGRPPRRIDIVTSIDGLTFEAAWPNQMGVEIAPQVVAPFIGLEDLLTNKRASGRPQYLADVAALNELG